MKTRRSMLVAYLLWFFVPFGAFGLHRFYCGRWITGLIWMFTAGLLGVGWLFDSVLTYYMVKEENEAIESTIGYRYVYTGNTPPVKHVKATVV